MRENQVKEYIECECGSCSLRVELLNDVVFGKEFDLAMFYYGKRRHGWRGRLAQIWRIVRTGSPYADTMCLSVSEAKKLSEFIHRNTYENPRRTASGNTRGQKTI